MSVDIAIHLFGSAEFELDDYDLTGEGLREFASDLAKTLSGIATVVDKLCDDGWSIEVARNNIKAWHPGVRSFNEAVQRLTDLGIDQDDVTDITEWSEAGDRLTPA